MQGIQDERDDNVGSSLAPQVGPPGKMSLLLEALTHASSTLGSEDHFEIGEHVGKRNREKSDKAARKAGKRSRCQISGNNEMASMSRSTPFPRRLFNMVASESKAGSKVVMWSDDGRAFFVQDEHSFIEEILPKHGFKASKIASFQRNLNIYGFQRMTRGAYIGGYVHQRFHRGMSESELSKITRREPKTSIPTEVSSDNLGQLVAQGGKPAVLKPPKIAVSGEILLNKSPSSGIYRETETPTVEASALLSLQQKASSSAQVSPIGVEKL